MNLANEGLEAKKKEDEVSARKRKAEEDKQWEGVYSFHEVTIFELEVYSSRIVETREQRVDSWRNFSNTKKKKKTKVALLG